MVVPPLLAAHCHSTSVGSRFPAHAQNAVAWFQSTQLTGWLSRPATCQLHALPGSGVVHVPTVTHAAYYATVTSVLSILKAETVTDVAGATMA